MTDRLDEVPLPGGFVNAVVRAGDTVRRTTSGDAAYVHELLELLAAAGWSGAPRYLGTDDRGREILTYLDGHVAWEPDQPAAVASDASLARVAALVREFHDLTAGTPLAGDAEVACHNDLSPKNTVYRDDGAGLRPVAFLDWDAAGPGRRVHDVAHVCWQYLDLGPAADPDRAARGAGIVADAYDLAAADRAALVATILWWQRRCADGIDAEAAAGDPAKQRLRAGGVPDAIRGAAAWVEAHRDRLTAAVTSQDR